jgi:hypothetical protein
VSLTLQEGSVRCPPLAPWKALRRPSQVSVGHVAGSDAFASKAAGSVPPVSVAVGEREVPEAPASPSPNPTPTVGAVLSEAEVERSIQMGMALLE